MPQRAMAIAIPNPALISPSRRIVSLFAFPDSRFLVRSVKRNAQVERITAERDIVGQKGIYGAVQGLNIKVHSSIAKAMAAWAMENGEWKMENLSGRIISHTKNFKH
jgi:hypothetical protein